MLCLDDGFSELRGKFGFFASPEINITTTLQYIINLEFANASLYHWAITPYRWMKLDVNFMIKNSTYTDNSNCDEYSIVYEEQNVPGSRTSICTETASYMTSWWTNILYVSFVDSVKIPGMIVNFEQFCDLSFRLDSGVIYSPEHPENIAEDLLPLNYCRYFVQADSGSMRGVVFTFDGATITDYQFSTNTGSRTVTVGQSGSFLTSNYSVFDFSSFTIRTDIADNGNETRPFGFVYRFIRRSTYWSYPGWINIDWVNSVSKFRSSFSSPFFVQFQFVEQRSNEVEGQLMRHVHGGQVTEFFYHELK